MKNKVLFAAIGVASVLTAGADASDAPERLLLQKISTHSAVVKWRGGDGVSVCYSRKLKNLEKINQPVQLDKENWPDCVDGVSTAGQHMEAQLEGLTPGKDYYYSVGGLIDESQHFRTATKTNKPPEDRNTHILIVGDSGTQTEEGHEGEAAEVLAGYMAYSEANGMEAVDLFLALGDNAYTVGTDEQWQGAFFDIYPEILKSAFTIPTIGNHEMGYGVLPLCIVAPTHPACDPPDFSIMVPFAGVSISSDSSSYDGTGDLEPDNTGMPYLDIFSLPTAAESGGVPSGTEQYYSVDYGNIHVVSLDTQLTARDGTSRAAMKAWVESDLANNNLDWTIVIFHHPPYTKGANHDSDDADGGLGIDQPEWDMRNEFTPVFEEYGVDVVYSGHSHSYERSYYLRGHTGTSDTFSPAAHAELVDADPTHPASGREGESYSQLSPTSGGVDDRVVYTVAGSSGKANDSGGFTTTDEEWLRHAAHIEQPHDDQCQSAEGCRSGLGLKGSVVIDAGRKSLRARFVDVNGDVLDEFTINR